MAYGNYGECDLEGCDTTTIDDEYCHYHTTLTKDRHCAYQYHKTLNGVSVVAWCSAKDKRMINVDCENCKEQLEPIENIELIENNLNLNQGE